MLYLTNEFMNQHLIRCLTNSVETILHLVLFNAYFSLSNKFDRHLVVFNVCFILAFAIRNTSPISWIPLILYKAFLNLNTEISSLYIIVKGGIFVALPILILVIGADCIYYGQFTLTSWNFLKINVLENRSADFGVSSPWEYFQ